MKRLLAMAGAIVALTVVVPSASAASHKAFHLQKTCPDASCIVLWSTFEAMPQGTVITYEYNGDGSDGLAFPTVWAAGGTTTGVCDWNHPTGPIQARCTFDSGTGSLAGFHLTVRVSANANGSIWYWDGTYWFGN